MSFQIQMMGATPFKGYADFRVLLLDNPRDEVNVMCVEVGVHSPGSFTIHNQSPGSFTVHNQSPGSFTVHNQSPEPVLSGLLTIYQSIESGIRTVTVSGGRNIYKHVPKTLSELLANMYICGTYNFLDKCHSRKIPGSASWTSWGVLLSDRYIPVRKAFIR